MINTMAVLALTLSLFLMLPGCRNERHLHRNTEKASELSSERSRDFDESQRPSPKNGELDIEPPAAPPVPPAPAQPIAPMPPLPPLVHIAIPVPPPEFDEEETPDEEVCHHSGDYEIIETLHSVSPGSPLFRDGFGQTVKLYGDRLFVAAPFARSETMSLAVGAVYVYKKIGGDFVRQQIIEANGTSDHLGALKIEPRGSWLFISLFGTPAGPQPDDSLLAQDLRGSVQIYRLNKESDAYEFIQAIDSSTPGLEDLTPTSPGGLDPLVPWFLNQQGASFGFNFSVDADKERLLVGAQYQVNLDEDNEPLMNSGAAYLFEFKSKKKKWVLIQKITNPEGPQANDTFGYNLFLHEDFALISNGTFFQGPKFGPVDDLNHGGVVNGAKTAAVAENSNVYVYSFKKKSSSICKRFTAIKRHYPNC